MEKFKDYMNKLKDAKNISEFAVKKDFNYTVAFIQTETNTVEGIYRSLLPSFYLNNLTTIRAFPVGRSEQMNSVSINQKEYEIKRNLAEITDHIIFPFTSLPLKGVVEELKKINPKLKFSYYIDYNFYFIPDSFPFMKEYAGAEIIANIEENITVVDQVIVTNRSLYNYLSLELSKKDNIKGCKTDICHQPLYYDKSLFPKLPEENLKKDNKKVRFGIVMNQTHFSDLNFIKGILKEFLKNNSDKAEIVLMGWNGMYKGKNYLSNIDIEYHPPVPFFDYFEKLISLNIDCFIIPAKDNKFNTTSKNYIKGIEFTRLNTPIIAPDIDPYKEIFTHNDNAVLCKTKENWLFEMETFLKDPDKYYGLKDRAFVSILEKEISEKDNIENLLNIYEI